MGAGVWRDEAFSAGIPTEESERGMWPASGSLKMALDWTPWSVWAARAVAALREMLYHTSLGYGETQFYFILLKL